MNGQLFDRLGFVSEVAAPGILEVLQKMEAKQKADHIEVAVT